MKGINNWLKIEGMFGLFLNKVKKYGKLKEDLQKNTKDFIDYCEKQNSMLKSMNDSFERYERFVREKGAGKDHRDALMEMIHKINKNYLLEVTRRECELLKSKNSIDSLEQNDPDVKELSKYEMFFTKSAFDNYIITFANRHKRGEITDAELMKISEDILKFKTLNLNGTEYRVKDNRKHFADMILFNQNDEVLFVQRNKQDDFEGGRYALPGGHVEPAEDYKQAAIRETKVKVGIELDPLFVYPCGVYEDHKVYISYFCTKLPLDSIEVLEGRGLQNYEWRSFEKLFASNDLIINLKSNFETKIVIPDLLFKVTKEKGSILNEMEGEINANI